MKTFEQISQVYMRALRILDTANPDPRPALRYALLKRIEVETCEVLRELKRGIDEEAVKIVRPGTFGAEARAARLKGQDPNKKATTEDDE